MSKSFFFRLPFNVADATLPVIPTSDIEDFLEYDVESNPYEHWIFGSGADSLEGLRQGKVLTPQSTSPSFNAASMVVSTLKGKGLKTTLSDAASMTIVAVMKRPAAPPPGTVQIVAGTLEQSGGNGAGSAIYFNSSTPSDVSGNIRGGGATTRAMGLGVGAWMFVAHSEGVQSTSIRRILYVGGQASNAEQVVAGPKIVSPHEIVLGNGYYSGGVGPSIEVAEFLLFDRFLTLNELDGLYARTKLSMSARGLSLA